MAVLPTPVERAARLDRSGAEVWVKRDDLSSPAYGGGKVRKLEWLLANAPHDHPGRVLSFGAIGSHHLLALAVHLGTLGRQLDALVCDQVLTAHARDNLAAMASLGTRFWLGPGRPGLALAYARYLSDVPRSARGSRMEPGASAPLGCLGYVEAALELAQQVQQGLVPPPRRLYVTAGTSGTAAGLALGCAVAGLGVELCMVSAVERWAFNPVSFQLKLAQLRAALGRWGLDLGRGSLQWILRRAGVGLRFDHSAVGRGYAVPTAEGWASIDAAREAGLTLESTYTGKCLAAMGRDLERRPAGGPVLWWNTHASNDVRRYVAPGWRRRLPAELAVLVDPARRPVVGPAYAPQP